MQKPKTVPDNIWEAARIKADGVLMSRTGSVDQRVGTFLQRNHAFGFPLGVKRDRFTALVIGGDQRWRKITFLYIDLTNVYAFAVSRDCLISAAFRIGGKSFPLRSARALTGSGCARTTSSEARSRRG